MLILVLNIARMHADDVVMCGGNVVDMTSYLESWRRALDERGLRVSEPIQSVRDVSSNKRKEEIDKQCK